MEIWESDEISEQEYEEQKLELNNIILAAFGYADNLNVDLVYPKHKISENSVNQIFDKLVTTPVKDLADVNDYTGNTIEKMFEKNNSEMENPTESEFSQFGNKYENRPKKYTKRKATVIDMLNDKTFDRESKITELCRILDRRYPELEGDKVTFIGSTFMRYGEKEPYFNHCIALDTCDDLPDVENSQIECYKTEREVLLAWRDLIQK